MRHLYLTLQEQFVIDELLEGDYDSVRPSFQRLLDDQAVSCLIHDGAARFNSHEANIGTRPHPRLPFVPHLGALRLNAKAQVEHRAVRHYRGFSDFPGDGLASSPTGMRLLPWTAELVSDHRLADTFASEHNAELSRRLRDEGTTDFFVSQDQSTWHIALSIEPRRRIGVLPLTDEAKGAISGVRISPRAYIHIYPHGGMTVTIGLSLVFGQETAVTDVIALVRLLVRRHKPPAFELTMRGLKPGPVHELVHQLARMTRSAVAPAAPDPAWRDLDYALSISADDDELSDAELSGLLTLDDRYEILNANWLQTRASLYGKYGGDRVIATRKTLAVATSPKNFAPSGRRRFFWRCHAIKELAAMQVHILHAVQVRMGRVGTRSGPDEATTARLMAIAEHLIDFPRGLPAHHRKWFYECQRLVAATTLIDRYYEVLGSLHRNAQHDAMIRRVEHSAGIRINLTNSQIGTLNLGSIVGDVETHLAAVTGPETEQLRDALQRLAQAVVDDDQLDEQVRKDVLESVALLAEEAGKQPDKRRGAVVRMVLSGLGGSLSAAGGLAEVWSAVGPTLVGFFGG